MEPSVRAAISPYLETALRDIDAFFAAEQGREQADSELDELFRQMEADRTKGAPPLTKEQAESLGKPMTDEEWATIHHALQGGWPESCRKAAAWLREVGGEAAAKAIELALSELPTHLPDAEGLQEYRDTLRRVAERVRTILKACLEVEEKEPSGPTAEPSGQADTPSGQTDSQPGKGGRPPKGTPTVNAKMLHVITARPEAKGWTARQFAVAIGCGESTVKESKTWKHLAEIRRLARAEKQIEKAKRRR